MFFNAINSTKRLTPFYAKSDLGYLLLLILSTLLIAYLYGTIDYNDAKFNGWDFTAYREMAKSAPGINETIERPFAFRVLGPYLVGLLPFSLDTNFYLLNLFFSITLVCLFYALLHFYGFTRWTSFFLVESFIFNKGFFGFTLWDYFQINDVISLNFLVILFLSLWKNQWFLFAITFLMAALTREIALLSIPLALGYLWEKNLFSQHWPKAILALLPGTMMFCALRFYIPFEDGPSLQQAFFHNSPKLLSVDALLRLWITAFLPFSFIPLICYKQTVHFFQSQKYLLVFFVLVLFSTLFGTNFERLMAPCFIVFSLLIGSILRTLALSKWLEIAILALVLTSSLHHLMAHFALPNMIWTIVFNSLPLILISLVFYKYHKKI